MNDHNHSPKGNTSHHKHHTQTSLSAVPQPKRHSHHDHHAGHDSMLDDFKRRFWISAFLSLPVLILSPLIQRFFNIEFLAFSGQEYVAAFFASIIFFYGGKPFLAGARTELWSKQPGMMTLIGIAISVAYAYSMAVVFGVQGEVFFWELVTLIDVMLLGHWIEMRSVMGASKALDEIAKLLPATAHRIGNDGSSSDVELAELMVGDTILIKPGEKIPADGEIIDGETTVNQALVTGESNLVSKSTGQEVIGGSINQDGSITVSVKHTGEESYLARVADMVKSAQASQSRTQTLANRVALWLTIVAVGGGILTFIVWASLGKPVDFALSRMVTVMVIACPHALGLAIPLVVARSTTIGARSGILIKNRIGFEEARNIDTVVLDKTGTLTKGVFEVSKVITPGTMNESTVLSLAASVEEKSEHPLAVAIVAHNTGKLHQVINFQTLPGIGVQGTIDSHAVMVVSSRFLKQQGISYDKTLISDAQTTIYVVIDNSLEGIIMLSDTLRPESEKAVSILKERGIHPIMLTGDNEAVAHSIAKKLNISSVFAEVLPEDKQEIISGLMRKHKRVAMVGDGINDAPALATAHTGIAIGAGTDVAAETADIILVNSNPLDIPRALELSRATYNKMRQNVWWAGGYNIVAIPLAAGILYPFGIVVSPAVGAALMSVSTIIVAINARRLKL